MTDLIIYKNQSVSIYVHIQTVQLFNILLFF